MCSMFYLVIRCALNAIPISQIALPPDLSGGPRGVSSGAMW